MVIETSWDFETYLLKVSIVGFLFCDALGELDRVIVERYVIHPYECSLRFSRKRLLQKYCYERPKQGYPVSVMFWRPNRPTNGTIGKCIALVKKRDGRWPVESGVAWITIVNIDWNYRNYYIFIGPRSIQSVRIYYLLHSCVLHTWTQMTQTAIEQTARYNTRCGYFKTGLLVDKFLRLDCLKRNSYRL